MRSLATPHRGYPFLLASQVLLLLSLIATAAAYNLQNKRVLVTGSSGGIGRGIALELAQAGAHVLVHYNQRQDGARETARLIEERNGVCPGISQCDFSHPAHIHSLFQQIHGIWPEGIDVLVNNAGVVAKLAMEDDDDYVTEWRDTLNINLNAPRLLSHMAIKGMKQRGGGVIINVSSIHGEKSNEYMSAYAVSKAGLDMLTKSMAMEYAEHNIRVNAIAPGPVEVERTAEYFRNPRNLKDWTDKMLVDKVGSVQEVAQATMPLITNDWITGTVWQIDGGIMARGNLPQRERPPVQARKDAPPQARPNQPQEFGMPQQQNMQQGMPQQQGMRQDQGMPQQQGMRQDQGMPQQQGMRQDQGMPQQQGMRQDQGMPQQQGMGQEQGRMMPPPGGRNNPLQQSPPGGYQDRPLDQPTGEGFVPMQDQGDYMRNGGGANSIPGRDLGGRATAGQGYIPREGLDTGSGGGGPGQTYRKPIDGTGYQPEQARQGGPPQSIQPQDANTLRGTPLNAVDPYAPLTPLGGTSSPMDGTTGSGNTRKKGGPKRSSGLGGTSEPFQRPGENSGWGNSNWPNGPSF
ncbi:5-keto-D-gluconate 5-reductase [Seminavis robusta]|uniref:5-keto-D-gluconate 5-reductase n=1 Tax=Seminavis robusta TaxID=568900 RepID=A0A9N8DUW2_9STRA|nr:5-keto-D-gluconate 5-reductase [Seminavis robusta]|eukprot:Sro376_g129790.1 5-keto-D-gluconate 5-reductase (574) ;mRNA; f:49301-51022